MHDPLTPREQAFADGVIAGMAAGRAYEAAGYKAKGASADSLASKLLRKDKIAAYIVSIQKKASTKAEMDRDDAVEMLVKIVKSKPSEASMENPLCELKMSKAGPFATFPDKSQCLARLAKLLGWDAPEKVEHGVSGEFAELIRKTRASA